MSSILKGIQRIVEEQVSSILYELSHKYGFCYEEEYEAFLAKFTLSNQTNKIKQPKPLKEKTIKDKPIKEKTIKEKTIKEKTLKEKTTDSDKSPKWKLPFNGTIHPSLCHAICRADGLYIQCKKNHLDDSDLCKTCQNYMLKNEKLPYGRIEERAEVGLYDFRFGKYAPLPYSIYMKKHELSRETVDEYAATLGITLDEQHFQEVQQEDVPKKKGGRKPKSAIQVVNATNANDNEEDDIRAIMDDIFQVNSDNDSSDSDDSDSDDDSGLQFSKKSNKSPPTPTIVKKHAKKTDKESEPEHVKEPVVTKETVKKSKKTKEPVIEPEHVKEPVVSTTKETVKKSKKTVIEPEHVKEPVVSATKETTTKETVKKSKKTDKEPVKAIEPEPVVTKETTTKETTTKETTTKETTAKKSKKTDKEPEPVHVKQPVTKESANKSVIELVNTKQPTPANKEHANKEHANKEPAKEIQVTGIDGQIWTIPVEPAIPLLEQPEPVKPVTVKKISYNGVKYFRNSQDNSIFDLEHNHVGTFDPATQTITFFQQDEDDEEEDDEDDEEEEEEEPDHE
jgi:hypothetical protein